MTNIALLLFIFLSYSVKVPLGQAWKNADLENKVPGKLNGLEGFFSLVLEVYTLLGNFGILEGISVLILIIK